MEVYKKGRIRAASIRVHAKTITVGQKYIARGKYLSWGFPEANIEYT